MTARKFVLLVVFAVVAGGAASWLSLSYMRGLVAAAPLAAAAPRAQVVVAARDLAPGTVIAAADVRLAEWGAAAVPGVLATSPESVLGRTVLVPLGAGEPVASTFMATAGAGPGVAGLIPDGMRAVSVPVDNVVGVNGFVLPGTRLDVIATMEGAAGGAGVTRLVLQNVEVLAAGHALQPDAEGTPQEVAVVTLLVTPAEAESLVGAMHRGRVQLALRNRLDADRVAPPPAAARAAAPRPQASPSAPVHTVEVFRGQSRSVVELPRRAVSGARE